MEVRLGKRYFGGFEDAEMKTFRRNTKIRFFNEDIGFLTMCSVSQEDGELYRTSDGGKSFTKVNIIENIVVSFMAAFTRPYFLAP